MALLGFLIERLLSFLEFVPEMLRDMDEAALGAVEVSTSHRRTGLGGTADSWNRGRLFPDGRRGTRAPTWCRFRTPGALLLLLCSIYSCTGPAHGPRVLLSRHCVDPPHGSWAVDRWVNGSPNPLCYHKSPILLDNRTAAEVATPQLPPRDNAGTRAPLAPHGDAPGLALHRSKNACTYIPQNVAAHRGIHYDTHACTPPPLPD